MKMEDHFKETLHRAVENEPPVLDAWDRFERRMGRSRRWRMVASIAGAAAVIVAAVIVVPQLGTNGVKPAPFATDPPTVQVTPGTFPIDDWNTYVAPHGYEIRYPRWWSVSMFEHQTEFRPYWLPGSAEGSPMIGVTFEVVEKPYADATADPTWAKATSLAAIDDGRTLAITLIQTDPNLATRYGWIARRIMSSVFYGTAPPEPPLALKHVGTVAPGIESDARLETLVDFLDARLQGRGWGAEAFLTDNAKQIYETELKLYDFDPPGRIYYEYRVLTREDADANSSEFVVEIITANISGLGMTTDPPSFRERVFVGAGTNYLGEQSTAVIRSASLE